MAEVIVRSIGNLRQEISAGPHMIVADEPADVGGDDGGPDPYELLLASLGACTSMTVLLYARRKSWPLEGVEVRLRHYRDHLRDCAECPDQPVQIDRIERRLTFQGPLDDTQRNRLLEIAAKCPVHRTLKGTIQIEDTLNG